MNVLSKEVRALQNAALGGLLLWRCAVGYQEGSKIAAAIPLPLLFVVLPITLHRQTADLLRSTQTRSGLRKFVEKFQASAESKTDVLLGLAARAIAMRELTMHSLQISVSKSLVIVDPIAATVLPSSLIEPVAGIPSSVRPLLGNAAKLGAWFSEISLYEVSLLLRVPF